MAFLQNMVFYYPVSDAVFQPIFFKLAPKERQDDYSTYKSDPPPEDKPEELEFLKSFKETPKNRYSFVSRKAWRAAKPKKTGKLWHPIETVVVNYNWGYKCLDRESCIEMLQEEQRRYIRGLGEDDIPFNFLVGDDGTIYEGRGWHFLPSKNLDYPPWRTLSYKRIDIAFIGNYKDDDRILLMRPVFDLMGHGTLMKYVDKDWHLEEWPIKEDEKSVFPPKNPGPPPPRLWW